MKQKDATMPRHYTMSIAGRSVDSADRQEIHDPATGELIGTAALADRQVLDDAVAAARAAFPAWAATPDAERKQACGRMAEILQSHAGELAELITRETGKTQSGMGAQFEIGGAIAWTQATGSFDLPTVPIRQDDANDIEMRFEPIGVCASITPWNWPLLIAVWHVMPAIRMGNTVVIKPSPNSPLNTLRMVELLQECLPAGVLNVVNGGNELGAAISEHPGIDKIVFTGSIRTGKSIMRSAAGNLKRLTLELGGNDAGIILPGTDVSELVEPLFWGAFLNSGQTCAALKRLYVHEDDYDAVCAVLTDYAAKIPMGNGMEEQNLLGPLQNAAQLGIVEDLVADAKAAGCRVLCGGERMDSPGYFFPITLLADAKDGMRVVDEEQFGPVLPIVKYTTVDEAVAAANGLEFGLAASVWGSDPELIDATIDRLEAGTVYLNKHADIAPDSPFGGIKQSGVGVEFGIEGLKAYANIKLVNRAKR